MFPRVRHVEFKVWTVWYGNTRRISAKIEYNLFCGKETIEHMNAYNWINYTIDRDTRWRGTTGSGTVTSNNGFF